jgi:hypothetical protein
LHEQKEKQLLQQAETYRDRLAELERRKAREIKEI